jgi:hypothetical protein
MLTATDRLLEDIGLHTPDTEDIFRSLFYTDNEYTYVRRNGTGDSVTHSNEWTQNVFELADLDCAKRFGGYLFGWNYRGPYQYGIRIGRIPETLRMTLLDVDDPAIVADLLTTPLKDHAIWCPSNTPGRWHVHVIHDETSFGTCEETVYAWREQRGYSSKQIQSNVTGPGRLSSITLPGQTEETLPCLPGDPTTPICSNYAESKQLFADWYRYKRVPLEDIFIIERADESALEDNGTISIPYEPASPRKKHIKADIPALGHSMGCTVGGQRYDFYSVDDCVDEGNGFLVSCSFIAALTRKHRANEHAVVQDALKYRQQLRGPDSKKHDPRRLLSHVKTTARWFCDPRNYDETKLKQDPQQELEDKTALIDFFLRDKQSLVRNVQKHLKRYRSKIREEFGRQLYAAAIQTIPWVIHYIDKANGRIARGTEKSQDEYKFSDSACWLDFPTIQGSRRTRDKIIRILKAYEIFSDEQDGKPTYDHNRHLSSRWTVCPGVLSTSDMRKKDKEEGSREPAEQQQIPSTNIATHSPEPVGWSDPERDRYWQCWHDPGDSSEPFEQKVAQLHATMAMYVRPES